MRAPRILLATCALLFVAAVIAWLATGARVFTRYSSAERLQAAEQTAADGGDFSSLFEGTGLTDEHGELERVENSFAFGLLPAGADEHAISVATVAGIAGAMAAVTVALGRRGRQSEQKD